AVLKAQRGQAHGVVLNVEIGRADARAEPGSLEQGSPSGGSRRNKVFRNRQQGLVAPHAGGPFRNGLARKGAAGGVKVALNLKRREAVLADGKRSVGVGLP